MLLCRLSSRALQRLTVGYRCRQTGAGARPALAPGLTRMGALLISAPTLDTMTVSPAGLSRGRPRSGRRRLPASNQAQPCQQLSIQPSWAWQSRLGAGLCRGRWAPLLPQLRRERSWWARHSFLTRARLLLARLHMRLAEGAARASALPLQGVRRLQAKGSWARQSLST